MYRKNLQTLLAFIDGVIFRYKICLSNFSEVNDVEKMFKFKRFRGSRKIYQKLFYDSEFMDMLFNDFTDIILT